MTTTNINNGTNSGVHAQNGFALQRNMAIYVLLDNYKEKFCNSKYFLYLEHHDDFIFCFHDEDDVMRLSEIYQSKKKSTGKWTLNAELSEILKKLLKTGVRVRNDICEKAKNYKQQLYFSSNASIFIEASKGSNKEGKKNILVNEEHCLLSFQKIPYEIQETIRERLNIPSLLDIDSGLFSELNNLNFLYVEMTRTPREQRNQLIGKLGEVFGSKICDVAAAIDTIFKIFSEVEYIYNQGNTAKISDKSKRITGEEISKTFHILTTQVKALDYWRSQGREISKILNIKPFEKELFEENIINSFDFFKDITSIEHKKILEFTINNYKECKSTTEEGAVFELFSLYKQKYSSGMMDNILKPIFFAAYFQAIE